MNGTTVFVHQSECEQGKVPKVGDVLTFQYEPRRQNPEQWQADEEVWFPTVNSKVDFGAV